MFEIIEETLDLCPAKILASISDLDDEALKDACAYVDYCENILTSILQDVSLLTKDGEIKMGMKDFENKYQDAILLMAQDIAEEMYNMQEEVLKNDPKNQERANALLQNIDGVEALLMLLPEEIEKAKCIILGLKCI